MYNRNDLTIFNRISHIKNPPMTKDYYQHKYKEYHDKTYFVNPASFLAPLAARLKPGATILDVGCGSGRDLIWFQNQGFDVTGLERSSRLAQLARENTGGKIIEADFEIFDFSQMSLDAIAMVAALVHLPHIRMPEVLSSIAKALKEDGKILLTLKEGMGRSVDSHGRVFHLWPDDALRKIFVRLEFNVMDFFRQPSKIGTDEVWLGYVIGKARSLPERNISPKPSEFRE